MKTNESKGRVELRVIFLFFSLPGACDFIISSREKGEEGKFSESEKTHFVKLTVP